MLLVRAGTELMARHAELARERALASRVPAELRPAAAGWDDVCRRLAEAVEGARAALGLKVVRHQLLLQRLARAGTYLRAAAACLCRASSAPDDVGLAERSVTRLLGEADGQLARMASAVRDEAADTKLSDVLYGRSDAARESAVPEEGSR